MNTVYLQTYFVTIACVLGTGILGLPVTLYNSGFYPFLVVFIISFVMQALIILIFVEILQKAYAIQVKYDKENQEALNTKSLQKNSSAKMTEITFETQWETNSLNSETELLPLYEMMAEDTSCDEPEDQSENEGPVLADHDIPSEQKDIRSPDLHLLGEMFLCNGIRHVFDIIVIFEMITSSIAYSLAGSGAYGEILGIKYKYVVPVFSWSLAFFIVFAFNLIQPVVSILSFIKATLFTMAVIMTFFLRSDEQENIQNNFNYIQDSFLVSTVTLGGSFFVMPFLFTKIENDALQIKKYRFAVVMGLATCAILNILCSNENGEISTAPLIKVLRYKLPSFFWMSKVVEVFIMISITVSFLTIGAAIHHIICGIVESNLPACFLSKHTEKSSKIVNTGKKCVSNFFSLIIFGIIFLIAMLNPKGFLDVIEKFTSFFANIGNFLIFVLFMATRNKENNKLKIPLPLPNMVMPFVFLIPLYYGFAIGYDIYYSVMSYLDHKTDKSHLPELQQHLHHNSSLLNVTSPLHVDATS